MSRNENSFDHQLLVCVISLLALGLVMVFSASAGSLLARSHDKFVVIRSQFLFSGYFRRDDLNVELFDGDGFYDTGEKRGGFIYDFATNDFRETSVTADAVFYDPAAASRAEGFALGVFWLTDAARAFTASARSVTMAMA